ncbi:sigma-54 dependent transcriptional regulator [Thermithiobacillus tepidarius DSM 3134]|uniref:sigma-54-dependent transcriptional regulator n=1 Tax=Thermithiobacillus tepidarius TaxID=929 RepID=UPI000423B031|nr:sigma-54 dependent transcriptional regulator [Thermithiobacillus tepidarius]
MNGSSVLLVAKNQQIQSAYFSLLAEVGCQLHRADAESGGLARLPGELVPDLILCDLEDDREGLERIGVLRRRYPKSPVIVLSDRDDWVQAVAAMKAGASEFLRKPLDPEVLRTAMKNALLPGASPYVGPGGAVGPERHSLAGLVGDSRAMRRVHDLIRRVAETDATVLVLGESGTGKEMVARVIHHHSRRSSYPFVALNCGAVPAELLESELFGHEKGAFTGAITSRKGRFELAARGSLLLDEIGEMSPQMQVKLLRVLQERTFERVGGIKSLPADARIIAATHRNLEAAIRDGRFREDLYYRLNVFPVVLPPLRERLDDVPLLVQHALERLDAEGRERIELTDAAMEVMMQYAWPGNVRELQNIIERLVILYPGERVDVADLPPKLLQQDDDEIEHILRTAAEPSAADFRLDHGPCLPEGPFDLKQYLDDMERELIQQALAACDGVVARAAARLNLRRTTLVEKIKKFGLRVSEQSVA